MIYYDTQQIISINSCRNSYPYNNFLIIFCILSFQETERSRVGHGDLLKSRKGMFSVMNIKYLYFQHMKQGENMFAIKKITSIEMHLAIDIFQSTKTLMFINHFSSPCKYFFRLFEFYCVSQFLPYQPFQIFIITIIYFILRLTFYTCADKININKPNNIIGSSKKTHALEQTNRFVC